MTLIISFVNADIIISNIFELYRLLYCYCSIPFFIGEKDGFVQVGPKKYLFPGTFKKHAEHFYNFKAREDDIWIATYPRSGTTWTQELVWMIANDLDYEAAQRDFLTKRSPFFE